jgi:hypothetical protein
MQIDVDFEVFKALTALRSDESVTYSDVLRQVLGINAPTSEPLTHNRADEGQPWVTKGVRFDHGTEFRARYKGLEYHGLVSDGALMVNGQRYNSPSAAGIAITGGNVNGWRFWEARTPGGRWKTLSQYR